MADEITTTETAGMIKKTRRWVIQLIKSGKIEARKLGRDWAVKRSSVEGYIEQQEGKGEQDCGQS